MRTGPRQLCLVVPVFNEAAGLPIAVPKILDAARQSTPKAEIVLIAVDDGSSDASAQCLRQLQEQYPQLRVLAFTRNFGKEAALQAGLDEGLAGTQAEVFIVIDADLQHPPALIGEMLERWRRGAYVVEAVKRQRGEDPWLRRSLAGAFYRLFARFSGIELEGATDFKLLDRQVARQLQRLPERTRFFRGIVSWLGYPAEQVSFDLPPRAVGRSGWGLWALFRYGWHSLTAFSSVPLQLVTLAGTVGLITGLALAAKAVFDKLSGHALSGFSTVILLQVIFGSLVLLSLGVIGSYLSRIYEELKRRPHYVLRPELSSTEVPDKESQ